MNDLSHNIYNPRKGNKNTLQKKIYNYINCTIQDIHHCIRGGGRKEDVINNSLTIDGL